MSEIASGESIGAEHSSRWHQAGKIALAGTAIMVAAGIPAAARTINALADMDPTHVPVAIGGSTVEAELTPGDDTIKVEAFGNAAIHPSNYHLGHKTFGVRIAFDTEGVNLATKAGTPDVTKLEAIARQFSDPTPQRHTIEAALKSDVEHTALKTILETVGLEALLAGGFVLARRRIKSYQSGEERLQIRDAKIIKILGAASVGIVGVLPVYNAGQFYFSPNHHQTVTANKAFAGTPAAGWQVKGPFASFVDVSWQSLNKISTKKNNYYNQLKTNFDAEFYATYGVDHIAKPADTLRLVFFDDTQGMDGPVKIVGAAARAFNADDILIGGDTEDSDNPYVSVIDRIHDEADGRKVIMGTGSHDPADIFKIAKERGFTVADNKIHQVEGVSILPVADANSIPAFTPDRVLIKQGYNNDDVTRSIIETACTAKQPVIVVVHDNKIGTPLAANNCPSVPLVLMGRSYVPPAPIDYGNTVSVTSGSTGGHTFGEGINISGIIPGKASFHIIDVDKHTLEFKSDITVTMDPVPVLGMDTTTPSTTVKISQPLTRNQIRQEHPVSHLPSKPILAERKQNLSHS